jgi:hypothetical protein
MQAQAYRGEKGPDRSESGPYPKYVEGRRSTVMGKAEAHSLCRLASKSAVHLSRSWGAEPNYLGDHPIDSGRNESGAARQPMNACLNSASPSPLDEARLSSYWQTRSSSHL